MQAQEIGTSVRVTFHTVTYVCSHYRGVPLAGAYCSSGIDKWTVSLILLLPDLAATIVSVLRKGQTHLGVTTLSLSVPTILLQGRKCGYLVTKVRTVAVFTMV